MILLLNRAKIFPGVSANMKDKDKVKHLRSDYYCGVGLGADMIIIDTPDWILIYISAASDFYCDVGQGADPNVIEACAFAYVHHVSLIFGSRFNTT